MGHLTRVFMSSVSCSFARAAWAFAWAGRLEPDNGEFQRNLDIARGLKAEKAP